MMIKEKVFSKDELDIKTSKRINIDYAEEAKDFYGVFI